eukprot:GFKZ01004419.1.p1 GENE.GFKZ01004419.1~~GFKZ01004419.1.p1  ORF type:complete len:953 (+),score=120.33 GFKZ01004419.1:162-2861(+)
MAPSSQPNAGATVPASDPATPSTSQPLITRGSAPRGTFDSIPDTGLAIPESKSFLARFRAGLSVTDSTTLSSPSHLPISSSHQSPARLPPPQPKPRVPTPTTAPTSQQPTTQPKHPIEPTVAPKSPSPSTPSPRTADIPPSTPRPDPPTAKPTSAPTNHHSPYDLSLLSDDRPTYPVLRFCAANALLDQHALDTLGLPLGFIWAPFGPLPHVPQIHQPPNRCRTCGSFLASHNGPRNLAQPSPTWQCVFCLRHDNPLPAHFPATSTTPPQPHPQLTTEVVDYVHHGSATHNSAGRGAIVVIVDENLEREEAVWARAAVAAVHASAVERGLRFALLTVGPACSIAVDGGLHESRVMEVVSPQRVAGMSPEEKEQFFLRAPEKVAVVGGSGDVDEGGGGGGGVYTDSFVCARAVSATAELAMEFGGLEMQAEAQDLKTRFPVEREPRRLDLAVDVALELISGMADADSSRVLSLLTGPPSLPPFPVATGAEGGLRNGFRNGFRIGKREEPDPGAALSRLYEQIGAKAGDLRIALDFLCFGASQGFAGAILLNTSKRSKGGLVYSAAHGFSAASALAEAATFLAERSSSPGLVSVRVSAPLTIARVIGPAFPTAAPHTYAVPGIDPTIGFTVILKPKAAVTDPALEKPPPTPSHAVVQLAAKSLSSTRVITIRIPLTTESQQYLRNLDSEVCALVLGKACIVSGGALTQPHIAARSIDLSARRLLRGSEATAGVVRLLYELRRGLLIDKQLSVDTALVLRSFFLRGECGLASLLMSPRLFTSAKADENTGIMTEAPLESSYVSTQAILVLDTGFNVFVYVGEEVSPETEEAISESAQKVAAQRISPCQLWKLHPGPDAEYLLEWYLADSGSEKRGASSAGDGFIRYCKSLAPDSITVRLLQS